MRLGRVKNRLGRVLGPKTTTKNPVSSNERETLWIEKRLTAFGPLLFLSLIRCFKVRYWVLLFGIVFFSDVTLPISQLGFAPNNLPIYDDMEVSLEPISHLNHRLLTTLGQSSTEDTIPLLNKKSTVKNNNNNNNQPEKTTITDEMMNNLLYHTDLQFETTHDRGGMEL